MSSHTILNPVIGVAMIGLQLRARPGRGNNQRLVLVPAVLGLIETVDNVQKLRGASAAQRSCSISRSRLIVVLRAQRLDPTTFGWVVSGSGPSSKWFTSGTKPAACRRHRPHRPRSYRC